MNKPKYLCILLVFLYCCSTSTKLQQEKIDTPKFIIISNVGNSNYFIAPVVISTDTIKNISYKKGVFDLHAKYKGFRNYVISQVDYEKLFIHLNMFGNNCKDRSDNFIKEEKNILIIDCRNRKETDCELLSIKSISTALYTLNNLYCYLQANNFDKNLITHIKGLHKFYADSYDPNNELYLSKINCN